MTISAKERALNDKLEAEIMQNPEKMPRAVYYIVPNEFGERFCFYGITPLLNRFFRNYLALGLVTASKLTHAFKFLAYFTPLAGAAVSDTYLGKYETIVYLSFVYVFGVFVTALFSTPGLFGSDIPSVWGPMIGLVLVAIGTGGIKPCVSAHGGDQFLEIQKVQLNNFYNYFYMAINAGSVLAILVTPVVVNQKCFGKEDACYTYAYGICGVVMLFALIFFMYGKRVYRIVAPSKMFIPIVACQMYYKGWRRYLSASPSERLQHKKMTSYVTNDYPADIIKEVDDLKAVLMILLPSAAFWMAFDQSGSTWQNQYIQMNSKWFGFLTLNEEQCSVLNGLMIIALVPVFTGYIYPFLERKSPFKLIDRLLVGMGLTALSFLAVGVIQYYIDQNMDALVYDPVAETFICPVDNADACVSGAWHLLPYFIMTCAEILFSISGLNLMYQEVGVRTKASAAALWLLMVSFGNLIAMSFSDLIPIIGSMWYIFVNMAIVILAMIPYFWIRNVYVYRADREENAEKPEPDHKILDKLDEVVRRVSAAHLAESIKHKEI